MAQEEAEWLKKELQRVEQEIQKKELELRGVMQAKAKESLIPLIREERDRLVEKQMVLLSTLQARLATPSGDGRPTEVPEGLQNFAKMASSATTTDHWLYLADGVHFIGDSVLGSAMYVREAYILLEKHLEALKASGIGHVVISGNPGLGKSWFAMYMLIRWLQKGYPVLWHGPKNFSFFNNSTVSILSEEAAVTLLTSEKDSNLRYIADGIAPLLPSVKVAQSLVAHSPDEKQYKEYMKRKGHLPAPLYMPFWEVEELEAVRQKLYPHITRDEMLELIALRGEVPRYVLDNAGLAQQDTSINSAIANLQPEDITGAAPGTLRASHRIARIHPPLWREGNFHSYKLSFLSSVIQEKVAVKVVELTANDATRFGTLLNKTASELGGILGATLYESLVHTKFKAGGAWERRYCPPPKNKGPTESKLGDPASSSWSILSRSDSDTADSGTLLPGSEMLQLPPLCVRYISTAEDLYNSPPGNHYVQPTAGNFPAIDSIAVVGSKAYLFQITQDTQHKIKSGLCDVLAWLPEHLDVEFVWVLPPRVWGQETFNVKELPDLPQQDSKTAGKWLPDRWELVEQRLRDCQKQVKIGVDVGVNLQPSQPQPPVFMHCGMTTSEMIQRNRTSSAVKGLNLGRCSIQLPPIRPLTRPSLYVACASPSLCLCSSSASRISRVRDVMAGCRRSF